MNKVKHIDLYLDENGNAQVDQYTTQGGSMVIEGEGLKQEIKRVAELKEKEERDAANSKAAVEKVNEDDVASAPIEEEEVELTPLQRVRRDLDVSIGAINLVLEMQLASIGA